MACDHACCIAAVALPATVQNETDATSLHCCCPVVLQAKGQSEAARRPARPPVPEPHLPQSSPSAVQQAGTADSTQGSGTVSSGSGTLNLKGVEGVVKLSDLDALLRTFEAEDASASPGK